jgi:hypothetical protein
VTSHIIVDVFDNTPSAVNVATQLTLRCGIKILSLREAYILQWTINNDTATVRYANNYKKTIFLLWML